MRNSAASLISFHRTLLRALAPLLILLAWGSDAFAQAPKVGREKYTDNVDLGFEIKQPKDWDLIPPSPSDENMVVKFTPRYNKSIQLSPDEWLSLDVYLVRFDKRLPGDEEDELDERIRILLNSDVKTAYDYVDKRLSDTHYGKAYTFDKDEFPKELKGIKGVDANYTIYDGFKNPAAEDPVPVKMFVSEYVLNERTTIAMIGFGPGAKKKWREYEKAYEKLAKSLRRVDIEDPFEEARNAPDAHTLRGKKRIELLKDVAKSGDWKLYETENYFIISANEDKEFMKELMERLEAIRAVYEEDYPVEKARRAARRPTTGEDDDGPDGGALGQDDDEEEEDPDAANRTISVIDPLELSKTSVVRVCRSSSEYHEYGGPGGSAGYWSSGEEELVIYDDKANGGRANTWLVLNHEAFHQYIYYFYGSLAPHSWYNEGTGDYYSGYQLKSGRFRLKENSWRKGRIQEMIREEKYVPLKDLVTWSKSQYYGNNDLGFDGGMLYAQGWSFIYFLRTAGGKVSGWQDSWDGLLDTYLDELSKTGDLEEAVKIAFEGVDWEAMEKAWKSYIG